MGRVWAAAMSPTWVTEPVSLSTSQPWATDCIHVPANDTD